MIDQVQREVPSGRSQRNPPPGIGVSKPVDLATRAKPWAVFQYQGARNRDLDWTHHLFARRLGRLPSNTEHQRTEWS
ncbi:hypothetical protein B296_00048593 [Ensete ventricosum]|uniref:Uncharacterized protein n=1 Tax=Ensete ventricosum TaxID=4639 RepID=A0A426WYB4_ENSVE|nr:hypothetical protein B296_00048593 [Ensete ventricosum]